MIIEGDRCGPYVSSNDARRSASKYVAKGANQQHMLLGANQQHSLLGGQISNQKPKTTTHKLKITTQQQGIGKRIIRGAFWRLWGTPRVLFGGPPPLSHPPWTLPIDL